MHHVFGKFYKQFFQLKKKNVFAKNMILAAEQAVQLTIYIWKCENKW
jgi:hypothetical protein